MKKIAEPSVDLRRGVDHIGVSVCFIVHDGQGRILLQKRGPNARDEQGRWDVGGGAIEFGESIEDAVVREIREELGCTPLEVKFLQVYDAHRQHQGHSTHWIAILHAVKVDPKEAKIGEPDKISQIDWFGLDNLPSPLHSQFEKSLLVAKEHGLIA